MAKKTKIVIVNGESMRTCSDCGKLFPLSNTYRCKPCNSIYQKNYRERCKKGTVNKRRKRETIRERDLSGKFPITGGLFKGVDPQVKRDMQANDFRSFMMNARIRSPEEISVSALKGTF